MTGTSPWVLVEFLEVEPVISDLDVVLIIGFDFSVWAAVLVLAVVVVLSILVVVFVCVTVVGIVVNAVVGIGTVEDLVNCVTGSTKESQSRYEKVNLNKV